ncbi:centromere protein F-like isoform X2 [Colossoma macropomum]|uniref:centromere protein F-like isoform X2 n=1 Tax=Colossoma macropomum TaxID=42526 RepID=UPI001864D781|nr:centromere protein F-like isoform X2 [Colossoma macropomum]
MGLGGRSGDDSREKGEEKSGGSEDETAQTHSLQEQVQALQSQLQLLSEQNREQAEELKLWRLSASSLGETMDDQGNGSPIMLVREDQLVLSCSPTALHMYSQQSSIGEYRDLSQPKGFSGLETGQDERDKQLSSQTAEKFQSVLKAEELIADYDSTTIKVDDQHKMETVAVDIYSTIPVLSSRMDKSGDKLDSAHPVKSRGPREDATEAVLVSLEEQSDENTFTTKVQEDCSATSKSETKAIDPKLNTMLSDLSDSLKPCLSHDEGVTLTQRLDTLGSTTDQQNEHTTAVGRQTDNSAQREDDVVMKFLATDQGLRSEAVKVTGSADHAGTKEVKSVSTQTEECSEREVEEVGRSIDPQERAILTHASTQTQVEEVKQPEAEDFESVDSPSSSPVPPPETEKLLFSGAFPIPANPAHLAERIRRNRSRMSAAYDDTEYEPYGLPEVVMKGFADIPSGPACPYVLRRGLLGTDALPVSLREPLREAEEDIDP